MTVSLGQSVTFAIGNEDSDGLPANASSIACTLYRNGASTATTVTPTNLATGVYSVAFTVPSGYADGDLLQVRVVADGIGRFVWGDTIAAPVGSTGTYAKIRRYRSDQTVMTFAWPVTGATITATRSVDNASYVSASGSVSFVRTESGKHYYALSYHASDRPAGENVIRFRLTDGTYTQYLIVDVVEDEGSSSGSGTGTGARTVTITVNDGTTVLQNARVRLTEGANTYTGLTNASGVVVFNVDDATYTVSITKSGYTFAGTTLVVDDDKTQTYSMTVVSVTPPDDPALCAVTLHLRNQYGVDLPGEPVEITWVQWDAAANETPPVLSVPPVQATDSGGLVEVNLYRDATYKIIYGNAPYTRRVDVNIPDAGTYQIEL